MEEDIKLLNDYLEENDRKLVTPKRLKFLQAIENLINKYKEQEKMIEIMLEYVCCADIDEEHFGRTDRCYVENACKNCKIDFFKKKVKGE